MLYIDAMAEAGTKEAMSVVAEASGWRGDSDRAAWAMQELRGEGGAAGYNALINR